jgi:cytochrome c-type biogenesis protein CcsB
MRVKQHLTKAMGIGICGLLLWTVCYGATTTGVYPYNKALEREIQKSGLPKLAVQYDGMQETLTSYARIQLSRILGRMKVRGQDPAYTILSMLYEPDKWRKARVLPIGNPGLYPLLGLHDDERKLISAAELFDRAMMEQMRERSRTADPRTVRALNLLLNRAYALLHLPETFLILPSSKDPQGEWNTPLDTQGVAPEIATASSMLNRELIKAFNEGQTDNLKPSVLHFLETVQTEQSYPQPWRLGLNYFNTRVNPFRWTYMAYLVSLGLFGLHLGTQRRSAYIWAMVALGLGFFIHSGGLVIRMLLAERAPLSNMYESIVFAIWGLMFLGGILELVYRKGIIGLTAAGFGLLVMVIVSFFPIHMTRIEPLRAVLNSSWLTYHVMTAMLSYSAFMLSFVFSLIYLFKDMTKEKLLQWLPKKEMLDLLNYRAIQIGWPLLTFGIFSGAVWANTAWGRPWNFDPKETWSLITWFIYTIFLHLRIRQGWRGRKTAIAAIVGFLAVLVTWIGVSYLPLISGGLHSYA